MQFREPVKAVLSLSDLKSFQESAACKEILHFVKVCGDAITGIDAVHDDIAMSTVFNKCLSIFDRKRCN